MSRYSSSIELPDEGDNIIRTKNLDVEINPNGLAHEIFHGLKKNKDVIGQIEADSGKSETYSKVLERSIRLAINLKKRGVTPNDIIAPCTTNHLNNSVLLFGILFTGAKPAWLDAFAPYDQILKQLQLVEPKFVFAEPQNVDVLEEIVTKLNLKTTIVLLGNSEKFISFEKKFLVPHPNEELNFTPYLTNDLFETAFIIFSSGTTGAPKGICLNHFGFLTYLNITQSNKTTENITTLSYVLLVAFSGVFLTCLSAILGRTMLLSSHFDSKNTWIYLQKYNVTYCFLAPYNFISFIKSQKPNDVELKHLKVLAYAGGAVPPEYILKARQLFPNVFIVSAYTQSELCGFGLVPETSMEGIKTYLSKPAMAGKPVKGLTYKIVNPETEEILGPNQKGELRIKCNVMMNGYHKELNKNYLDADGFLKTGDVMYYDDDHCFFFIERVSELLWYQIYPISPSEIESVLLQHPSVKIAVVIGIPSEDGDLPAAIVVKNNDNVTEEDLKVLVAQKLEDRKKLRGGVFFVEDNQISFTASD
nr:luciferin 4-monooxygenase-like [Onthophagus taurus]